jgi:hypothetical protein
MLNEGSVTLDVSRHDPISPLDDSVVLPCFFCHVDTQNESSPAVLAPIRCGCNRAN